MTDEFDCCNAAGRRPRARNDPKHEEYGLQSGFEQNMHTLPNPSRPNSGRSLTSNCFALDWLKY